MFITTINHIAFVLGHLDIFAGDTLKECYNFDVGPLSVSDGVVVGKYIDPFKSTNHDH